MIKYEDVINWTDTMDLITNRVDIVNRTLDAQYCGYRSAPCVVTFRKGVYFCTLCGSLFASWHIYNVVETNTALERLDTLSNGLWYLMRSGRFSYDSQKVNQHANIDYCWY